MRRLSQDEEGARDTLAKQISSPRPRKRRFEAECIEYKSLRNLLDKISLFLKKIDSLISKTKYYYRNINCINIPKNSAYYMRIMKIFNFSLII
ncbi:hypothetical protein C4B60_02885 [Jeotgalibacillus proteolyticus]|uniref:Uncharacterized protein n=1 Tax=Jeotgalibacillus proteolyticus TaxID=2082395 RepID=A0A2S5GH18_9BACL|nr:hypothetical protein C4B60_02885 [Jeotgalibacillus proteolyticus]